MFQFIALHFVNMAGKVVVCAVLNLYPFLMNINDDDAIDSFEMLDVLLGTSEKNRVHFVHHWDSTMALLQGD